MNWETIAYINGVVVLMAGFKVYIQARRIYIQERIISDLIAGELQKSVENYLKGEPSE